jgi:hypothetical protein
LPANAQPRVHARFFWSTDLVIKLKRNEEALAALTNKYKNELNLQKEEYDSVKSMLDLIIKWVNFRDMIDDEVELERLNDFLENMRKENHAKSTHSQFQKKRRSMNIMIQHQIPCEDHQLFSQKDRLLPRFLILSLYLVCSKDITILAWELTKNYPTCN